MAGKKDIQRFRGRVAGFIRSGRLRDAIRSLRDMSDGCMAWELADEINRTEQSYTYMLRYVSDGIDDPDRRNVYDTIVSGLYRVLDMMERHLNRSEEPTLYYNTLRYVSMRNEETIKTMVDGYVSAVVENSIFSALASGISDTKIVQPEVESAERELFKRVWVTFPFAPEDAESLKQSISDTSVPAYFKIHVLSAVTLGLLEFYDERRLMLLMDAYDSSDDVDIMSVALVGILLALYKYRDRPLGKKVENRLAAVRDKNSWRSDLKTAFIEIIRAGDTERISRKMRDEVIPGMMKMRPDIMRKIDDGEINPGELPMQENPEWEDLLRETGIADRLKELSEIQQEGGDVFMSTFAHLKHFPFFNDIANWFLPFNPSHSSVSGIVNGDAAVIYDTITDMPLLCDSDKYSFMLSLSMVPENQRSVMFSQLEMQRRSMAEAIGEAERTLRPASFRLSVNRYIRNIYRFYKLFRRKGEFYDPFREGSNLAAVPALSVDFNDVDTLQVISEFYFKLGYWDDALNVFERIDSVQPPRYQRYQKMGYCHEKSGRIDDALGFYQRSELLNAESVWTIRRIASCYRAKGCHDKAVEYYSALASFMPDDVSVALNLGYALVEQGDYKSAVKQFYKVEFLDEHSTKALRPLAWTLFLTGDFDASSRYYGKILLDNPTSEDYLNMGHVDMAKGYIHDAIGHYKLSVSSRDGDVEAFLRSLNDDIPAMVSAGMDISVVPLVADAVLYSLDNNS